MRGSNLKEWNVNKERNGEMKTYAVFKSKRVECKFLQSTSSEGTETVQI